MRTQRTEQFKTWPEAECRYMYAGQLCSASFSLVLVFVSLFPVSSICPISVIFGNNCSGTNLFVSISDSTMRYLTAIIGIVISGSCYIGKFCLII